MCFQPESLVPGSQLVDYILLSTAQHPYLIMSGYSPRSPPFTEERSSQFVSFTWFFLHLINDQGTCRPWHGDFFFYHRGHVITFRVQGLIISIFVHAVDRGVCSSAGYFPMVQSGPQDLNSSSPQPPSHLCLCCVSLLMVSHHAAYILKIYFLQWKMWIQNFV